MAKKKETEASIKVETKKDQVTVEMNPDQYDGYLDFMAKQADEKKLAEKKTDGPRIMHMDLNYQHHVSGVKYGPGPTDIPEDHVGQVCFAEHKSLEAELGRNISKERIFKIMQNGQAVPHPVKILTPGGSVGTPVVVGR